MTAVFPTLPGLDIEVKRTAPIFATGVQSATSGLEQRAAWWPTPKYGFELTFNFLRQSGFSIKTIMDEAAMLVAFFGSVKGQWGTFWFTDPYNSTAASLSFGTGNASTATFQLVDSLGVKVAPNGTPSVYVNGVLTTPSSISPTGLVTFTTAPASGASLTWSGSYFHTCRFQQDQLDLKRILALAWDGGVLKLITVK